MFRNIGDTINSRNSVSKDNIFGETNCLAWKRRTTLERYLVIICLILFIILIIMIGILSQSKHAEKTSKKEICLTPICKHQAGIVLSNMDLTVDPCENFYDFSCGSFLNSQTIYDENILFFNVLEDYMIYLGNEELKKPGNANDPAFVNKVRQYYKSCLNKPTKIKEIIEKLSLAIHLQDWPLTQSDDSRTLTEEAAALAVVYKDFGLLFNFNKDPKNSYIQISTGVTSITADSLLKVLGDELTMMREQYVDLVSHVFTRLNFSAHDAERYGDEIIAFETSLAQIQNKERHDASTDLTIAELESRCQQIKWKNLFQFFFQYLGHENEYSDQYPLRISGMQYIIDLCNLVGATEQRIVYNAIIWNMFIPHLARFDYASRSYYTYMRSRSPFYNEDINLLPGMETLKWKMCVSDMKSYIRAGLDYMMIKSMQPDEEIEEVKGYAELIRETFDELFSKQDWMNDNMKNITRFILKEIQANIGYGSESVDEEFLNNVFHNMTITDNYSENIFSLKKETFLNQMYNPRVTAIMKNISLLQPFKPETYFWLNETRGILECPLAVMQSPIYTQNVPHFLNFGGVGILLGIEFTHGFDRLDEPIDESNKLLNINAIYKIDWSKEFLKEFRKRTDCLVEQYSQFPLEGNVTINGAGTKWDNIFDNNGLILTYRAYEKYLRKNGDDPWLPGLDFNNKQMFFIKYAQLWCQKIDSMKETFEFHPSSPGKYRVLATLMNSPEFSKSFNCPLNSYMNPEHKCRIWG